MNENEMYALVGRKQTEFDNLNIEYNRLLSVLHEVALGQIQPSRLSVDLQARSWAVSVPDGE